MPGEEVDRNPVERSGQRANLPKGLVVVSDGVAIGFRALAQKELVLSTARLSTLVGPVQDAVERACDLQGLYVHAHIHVYTGKRR